MSTRIKTLAPITLTGVPQRVFTASPSPKIQSFKVRAGAANPGPVYVGDENVDLASGRGDRADAGDVLMYQSDAGHTGGHRQMVTDNIYVVGSAGALAYVIYMEYL